MLPEPRLSDQAYQIAVRAMLVDRLTAEVAGLFAAEGIDCILLKGPVIGDWLYLDGPRAYGDTDLLIPQSRWDESVALLTAVGFQDYLEPMAHPRLTSVASKPLVRGADNVDLHRTIDGLEAAPETVWQALWATAGRQEVGGRRIPVPARPGVLMHLALHTAHHHAEPKPLEDLRLGLLNGTREEWRQAAALARELDGLVAFATGLRRLPEGVALARTLGVEGISSVHFELRTAGVPTAEGLHELFGPGLKVSERAVRLLSELVPTPSFMRWWSPLASRGVVGLIASYPVRWAWLVRKAPMGLLALRQAGRRRK